MKVSHPQSHRESRSEPSSSTLSSLPSTSLQSQPETGAYFHLSCEEPICDAILDGLASIVADEQPSFSRTALH